MKFGEAISSVFSHYAGFSGRARRSEFWYFVLFNFLVSFVLSAIAGFIEYSSDSATLGQVLIGIWDLVILLPSLAVNARRLHDIGKSGWWMLISLIPVVGAIMLLVWETKDSQPGENQYGANPKGC